MANISFIGAGRWATTLALLLSHAQHKLKMWEADPKRLETVRKHRRILDLPPNLSIPKEIEITDDLSYVLKDPEILIWAVPAQALKEVVQVVQNSKLNQNSIGMVSVIKGIENQSGKLMSTILTESFPKTKIGILAGPGIPYEVAQGRPASLVSASKDGVWSEQIRDLFSIENLRVYSQKDIIGVELGGAIKNVVAIAAGLCDGLSLGMNAKAALLTRGCAEMSRLGIALNANPLTFSGLSGIGDLIVTSFSLYSRNRFVGESLAQGKSLKEILAELNGVAEGVETAKAAVALARRHRVEMPICESVERIIFSDARPYDELKKLLKRPLKYE